MQSAITIGSATSFIEQLSLKENPAASAPLASPDFSPVTDFNHTCIKIPEIFIQDDEPDQLPSPLEQEDVKWRLTVPEDDFICGGCSSNNSSSYTMDPGYTSTALTVIMGSGAVGMGGDSSRHNSPQVSPSPSLQSIHRRVTHVANKTLSPKTKGALLFFFFVLLFAFIFTFWSLLIYYLLS